MARSREIKTNAMRILDRMKIPYAHHTYECGEFVDGMQIVEMLGLDPRRVYKTLVTRSAADEYFVFVIPVAAELDLKKAAKAAGQKSLAMIHVREINQVTGYIRGGCTAVGMKKQYATVIDSSAEGWETIVVSGGRIGSQIELAPGDLAKASGARFAPVCAEDAG
ncbi:MAG TPA: Cys-tRNA(Pro) deacylase [Candidatus Eisenbergiella merdigallinarum]|uniref:Cys-tRNA(Pro)/Cys-tRNA(Cys) deacylase n=1 Tax=Candidatus Eisenbergiella merdigallinarum TaxID=2838552 RepID=A0A9D2MRP5_9FIRM|nr:Cys-tRNA(Pro) deacylase [Candidatus Eisenbergiella merdigallinarum]